MDASRVSLFSHNSHTHESTEPGSTKAPIVPACTLKPHCLHFRTFPRGPVFKQARHLFWGAMEIVGGGVDCTDVLV